MRLFITILFSLCVITHTQLTEAEKKEIDSIRKSLESINIAPRKKLPVFNFTTPWMESDIIQQLNSAYSNQTKSTFPTVSDVENHTVEALLTELDKVFENPALDGLHSTEKSPTILYHSAREIEYVLNDEHTEKNPPKPGGCSNLFFEYKSIIQKLQEIIDFATNPTSNDKNQSFQQTPKNAFNRLFLRNIHITKDSYQTICYDKAANTLKMELGKLKDMSIRDFAKWLIFQKQLIAPLLDFETKLKALFDVRYFNSLDPHRPEKEIYVGKN